MHLAAPHLLTNLLAPLLSYGHHLASLKRANGVVLDKPGKSSYDYPTSMRIIILLQTVSKVLERIAASRLALQAMKLNLLHRNQCGSLPSLSSFDACLSLVDTVRTLERPGLKFSTRFLDIKRGFDYVSSPTRCTSLRKAGVPHYLVIWVQLFLSQCSCQLLFQGSPRTFSPVPVGTPQGSPISPHLFVIYVSSLHIDLPKGVTLSYVDDFSLMAASLSYRTNIRILQKAFGAIRAKAHARSVDFDVPKTKLIHRRTPK